MTVEKNTGDEVFAGTINHNGVIKAKTTRIGENTTLSSRNIAGIFKPIPEDFQLLFQL
ncbi:MAG: hypothetical protein K9M56_00605 [Victivallales bacterium]|nr:hypothetical protein [Victivallales bacterium]